MSSAPKVVHDLDQWFRRRFAALDALRESLASSTDSRLGKAPYRVSSKLSGTLRGVVTEFLSRPGNEVFIGAGLILDRSLAADHQVDLEWWIRSDEGSVERHQFVIDPGSNDFYDYEGFEWFVSGCLEESRTLAGPYIDHLGVDDYIVTLAVPAYHRDERIGLVAADITVRELEEQLLPLLTATPGSSALLNPHGIVLVGSSADLATGDRVEQAPEGWASHPVGDPAVGLTVLHRD